MDFEIRERSLLKTRDRCTNFQAENSAKNGEGRHFQICVPIS